MLAQEDIDYIKKHLSEWLGAEGAGRYSWEYEIEMRERIVRVEEELKHQRELMQQGFELMDKRFEEMREDMNKRFEQVDKHFEHLTRRLDRFMLWSMGLYLAGIGTVIGMLWRMFPN